jgi:acyl-CoA dehydrogenase
VQAAEAAGWAPEVWETVAAMGLPWISVPEEAGGSGGTVADAVAVLGLAGAHAAPVPLAEAGLLAGWLLAGAGLPVDPGPSTVVPGVRGDDLGLRAGVLTGTARRVPWARAVERIVALVDGQVVVVAASSAGLEAGVNLAGEPRDTVVFDRVEPEQVAPAGTGVDADALWFRGALSRVALMAGALQALADQTAAYAEQRQQFGRPIAGFQAVQEHVVRCAEEAALVDLAAQVSAARVDEGPAAFEVASAKLLANDAVRVATRAAHQVHGAIGLTQEHRLHQLTRRLWSWRAEYGDGWSVRLGRAVAGRPPARLYETIADGSASGITLPVGITS